MAKRVLQVLWSGHIGGSEKHVLDLVQGLPPDFHCSVCFLTEEGELGLELSKLGIPWFSLGMRSGLDFLALLRLNRHIGANQFEIIHEHSGNKLAIYAYRFFAPQARTIFTQHNGEPLEHFRFMRLQGEVAKLKRFHRVLCVSEKMAASWARVAHIAKAHFVSNGVDLSRLECRTDYSEASSLPLLSVGRLIPSKRTDLLIRLLGGFLKKSNRILRVVGDGPEREKLQQLIDGEGLQEHVLLLGTRTDLPMLYANSSLFVSASQYESFGLAIAEAAAAGLPCVVVAIENVDRLVIDQKTGYLIPQEHLIPQFAEKVNLLLQSSELLESMGLAARKYVQANYSSEKMMEVIARHYHELLESP